jgi:hypothetical protein
MELTFVKYVEIMLLTLDPGFDPSVHSREYFPSIAHFSDFGIPRTNF